MSFVDFSSMERANPDESDTAKKFHLLVDGKNVYVEVISPTSQIYAVEFPGRDSFFITKIRNQNKSLWISMPQGNDKLAAAIGSYIDEQHHQEI